METHVLIMVFLLGTSLDFSLQLPNLANLPIVYTLFEGTQEQFPFNSQELTCQNVTSRYKVNFINVDPTTNCQNCFNVWADTASAQQPNYFLRYVPSASRLDYNAENTYKITLTCEDSVAEGVDQIVEVRIIPNIQPTFSTPSFDSVTVPSTNLFAGTNVYEIIATDSENDPIEYALETVPTSSNFDIRANGQIYTVNGFQGICTGQNSYEFKVRVKDPYNEFTDPISVTLDLQFPNLPSIGNANRDVTVPENSVQNIHTFTGVSGTISILNVQPSIMRNKVTLFGGNILRVDEVFNFEEFNTANVTLLVKSGECEARYWLMVRVQEMNDLPVLTPAKVSAAVPEGIITYNPGFKVEDEDFSDMVTYTIQRAISGTRDITRDFTINQEGIIISNFDFDLDSRGSEVELITFTVRATDKRGGFDESEVILRVENINDNPPVITTASIINDVLMDCDPPQRIATVAATDLDPGTSPNGQFQFKGSGAGNLRVTPDGAVFLDTPVTADTTYSYTIFAEDLGNPQLTSAKPITITVIGQACTTIFVPPTTIPAVVVTVPAVTVDTGSGAGAGAGAGAAAGVSASASSTSLLDDPTNLIWIIFLGLLGLLLLGLLAWLLWRFCFPRCCPGCYGKDSSALARNTGGNDGCCNRCCGKSNPTVGPREPEHYPEGKVKDFWQEHYQELDYDNTTHRSHVPTSGLHEDGYLNPR
ncbi:hypothetical protein SNE40_021608 [Patella caerulea]|uniref:Cadherin domain-containing protein n=1 Tax=Patella caerulea TaxID=87958 RepID=A0AAN8IZ92_PATCE